MWLYNIYLRLVNMDIIEVQLDYADGEGTEKEEEEVECKELEKDEKKKTMNKRNILNPKVISKRYLLLFLVFGVGEVVKIMLALSK